MNKDKKVPALQSEDVLKINQVHTDWNRWRRVYLCFKHCIFIVFLFQFVKAGHPLSIIFLTMEDKKMNRSIVSLCATVLISSVCSMGALAADTDSTAANAGNSLWTQNGTTTTDNNSNAVANQKLEESKALAIKAGQLAKESAQTAAQSAATAAEGIKLKAEKTVQSIKQGAQEVSQATQEAATQVGEKAKEAGQATQEAATQVGEKAKEAGDVAKTETLSLWERIKRAFGYKENHDASANNGNGSTDSATSA